MSRKWAILIVSIIERTPVTVNVLRSPCFVSLFTTSINGSGSERDGWHKVARMALLSRKAIIAS